MLRTLLRCSEAEWTRLMEGISRENGEPSTDHQQEWQLAAEVTEHLADMGQVQLKARAILRTKRRMDVYRNTMRLWRHQAPSPTQYTTQEGAAIMLITSTFRRSFFISVHGDDYEENFTAYGSVATHIEVDGEHTAAIQACATNRIPHVTAAIQAVL